MKYRLKNVSSKGILGTLGLIYVHNHTTATVRNVAADLVDIGACQLLKIFDQMVNRNSAFITVKLYFLELYDVDNGDVWIKMSNGKSLHIVVTGSVDGEKTVNSNYNGGTICLWIGVSIFVVVSMI